MPVKLNVGVSKKIGQPEFGSIGATCDVELDSSLLQNDLDTFHQRVQQAYVACRQAVNEELSRHQDGGSGGQHSSPATASPRQTNGNGRPAANGHGATDKQLDYAPQLARQIDGLGTRRLDDLADKMFGKPLAALTTLDASGLIDMLKQIKSGEVELDAVSNGAPV